MRARQLLAWSLWPLFFVAYLLLMVAIAWSDPSALRNWLGVTTLSIIVALVGLEEIFGTHLDPVSTKARAVGVERDPIPRAFASEVMSPFIFRRLVRNRARRADG